MLPSSAVQILESTPARLHIYCPPNYGLAAMWLVISSLGAMWVMHVARKEGKQGSWWLLMPGFFGFLGIFLLSTFSHVTLSAKDGTFNLRERYLFLIPRDRSYPLKELQQAAVETNEGGTQLLNFVFHNGDEVPLGPGYMNRTGYYQAANAVNSFLAMAASSPQGAEPNVNSDEPQAVKEMEERMRKQAEKYGLGDKPSDATAKSKTDSSKQ